MKAVDSACCVICRRRRHPPEGLNEQLVVPSFLQYPCWSVSGTSDWPKGCLCRHYSLSQPQSTPHETPFILPGSYEGKSGVDVKKTTAGRVRSQRMYRVSVAAGERAVSSNDAFDRRFPPKPDGKQGCDGRREASGPIGPSAKPSLRAAVGSDDVFAADPETRQNESIPTDTILCTSVPTSRSIAPVALCLCCPKVRTAPTVSHSPRLCFVVGPVSPHTKIAARTPKAARQVLQEIDGLRSILGLLRTQTLDARARTLPRISDDMGRYIYRRTASAPSADAQCRSMPNGRDFLTTV